MESKLFTLMPSSVREHTPTYALQASFFSSLPTHTLPNSAVISNQMFVALLIVELELNPIEWVFMEP